jgi:aminopeptidase N
MYRVLFFFLGLSIVAGAKDPYKKNNAIDIQSYVFRLEVNDSTDVIDGKATVSILFKNAVSEFELDLAGKNTAGMGMEVAEVNLNGAALSFTHENDRLKIKLPTTAQQGELSFEIKYKGIPQDGFIIGKNKFGDRGFFGDNWPDRGHHWLPVVDHPSDKAKVDFIITAPHHYSVIANGIRVEESFLDKKRKLTHWHEETPIPVKVMVAGVARFAVQYVGKVNDIQLETWVYPQNKKDGFGDFAVGLNVLKFFHTHVGPYAFKKLANVQSKTRWGGLENASAIFYYENAVNGKANNDGLIAHETAHQWFGDSATESDWHHVWLSEGFATYFSALYLEHAFGRERLLEVQKKSREDVIGYYKKNPAPIVDTTITDIGKVLSTNTYQKAGWVLHMLRHKLGDSAFWKGIRQYYTTYQKSNALTADFVRVMEQSSGPKLKDYFNQWLYVSGHPKLSGTWSYDAQKKEITIELSQLQSEPAFFFPLDIEVEDSNGKKTIHTIEVKGKTASFKLSKIQNVKSIVFDPNVWLLSEGEIVKK